MIFLFKSSFRHYSIKFFVKFIFIRRNF